jgi:diacylglycerol kinase family enzyme
VLNVHSGPDRKNAHSRLVELFFENDIRVQTFPAGAGKAVQNLAEQAVEEGYDVLIAAGGDGTVGTVAGVAAKAGKTLGVLPMGTFNHFARDLGISTDLPAAVQSLKSTRTVCVDLATVNGRPFVNTSSIGLYPQLVLEREHYRRSGLARSLAVMSAAFNTLREFRPVNLRLAASDHVCAGFTPFAFVGNNCYTLERSRIGSRARLDSGALWVSTISALSRWRLVKMLFETWMGRVAQNPDFHALTTKELRVDSNRSRLYVSRDGEVELLKTPLMYTVHHRALRVIVP